MKESLKVIENLVDLVYRELTRVRGLDINMNENAQALLAEAAVDAINLSRKIDYARGWIIQDENSVLATPDNCSSKSDRQMTNDIDLM